MSEKNKWALPSGAKEQIRPKWRSSLEPLGRRSSLEPLGRQVGVPTYFLQRAGARVVTPPGTVIKLAFWAPQNSIVDEGI